MKKSRWIKPEYCSFRNYECDQCENFKDDACSLSEEHVKILDDVMDRDRKLGKIRS